MKDIADEIPHEISCEAHGIAYSTFRSWLAYGKKDLEEGKSTNYTQFLSSVREVQTNRLKAHLSTARSSEKGHRGSEWILERAYWKYFSPKVGEIELHERVSELENKKVNTDVGETKADAGQSGEASEKSISDEAWTTR